MAWAERAERFAVPREALWALVADTERLNRELGLPSVAYQFFPRAEGGSSLRGAARFAGIRFHYDEEPYCWVRPALWSVRRAVDAGPIAELRLGVALAASRDASTRVVAWCEAVPRGLPGSAVSRRVAESCAGGLLRACRTFAAHLAGAAPTPYPRHAGVPPAVRERLERAVTALVEAGAEKGLARRLGRHLAEAPVEDVVDLRPFVLADRWGASRQALLQVCLMAVRAGLLELRWRVLCPACQGAGDSAASLDSLARGEAHCLSCNIRFDPEFDRNVEVCFSVAPAVRPTEAGTARFCVGGPMNLPHVALQWVVPPGGEEVLEVDLPPGHYRMRSPQAAAPVDVALSGDGAVRIVFAEGRFDMAPPPAAGAWRLVNRAPFPLLVRLEAPHEKAAAVTAAAVTALPAFRDAFGAEVLSPGAEIAVRQITLLFTDLKGSTALYAARGDAPSYAAVRDHFLFLEEAIGAFGGGVLKTIGDAVMAVFPDPAGAVAAALEIQRKAPQRIAPLTVKIGVHAGPALAVNANGGLDYFGQTVNVAARIQHESVGGDVVVSAALLEDLRVEAAIRDVYAEPFSARLRGASGEMALVRLWP